MPTSELENATVYTINAADTAALYGSSLTTNSPAIAGWEPVSVYNPWEDKLKEYCNSTDKHLDDLEEDIEFLDRERKNMNGDLSIHEDKINDLESKLDLLKRENIQLCTALNDLQNQIYTLQEKLDN